MFYIKRKTLGKNTYLQLQKYNWIFSLHGNIGLQILLGFIRHEVTVDLNPFIVSPILTVAFLSFFVGVELFMNELDRLKLNTA